MNWLLTTAVGALMALVLDELFDLLPWLARTIIRAATRTLPASQRSRYLDEWLAELEVVPGRRILRLAFAIRLLVRARHTAEALGAPPSRARLRFRRSFDVAVGSLLLAFFAPLLGFIAVALKLTSPRESALARVPYEASGGRRIDLPQFRTPPTRLGDALRTSGIYSLPWLWNTVWEGFPPRPTARELVRARPRRGSRR